MIFFNQSTREFHLQNKKISYIFYIMKNDQLGHLYFGARLPQRDSFAYMFQTFSTEVPITPHVLKDDRSFSLDVIKQEFPSYGTGDYREPMIEILQDNGSRIVNFQYVGHTIYEGKKSLEGLPATYVEKSEDAMSLEVELEDPVIKTKIILSYTIFKDHEAITRHIKIENQGTENLNIQRILSFSLDMNQDTEELITLAGAWARERHIIREKITYGKKVIESKRGTSSAIENPFLCILDKNTTEFLGEIYGFNLVYSGNFLGQVEKDHYGVTRVNMGINPFDFNWVLEPKASFQSPEAVMVYSNKGINGMSHVFHSLYQDKLIRGLWKKKERPILLNNWEATYFDFNEEGLYELAKKGCELGIELFVLDDGWFGQRNSDGAGLGDWFGNLEKIPSGIAGFSKKIEALGMKFGLWFEPEMVNPDSDLYRKYPDWIIHVQNRSSSLSRNQYVLDFSRADVIEYIYKRLEDLLINSRISYVKWDMNRCITEAGSLLLEAGKQREIYHRYILGVYSLLEKITTQFPHILFEACASGGNRFDPGMLYYMPQAWVSDNTDAIERLKIQYGSSLAYPISTMGAHVSAVPNHQTGRVTNLKARAEVAYFGIFGYELDLRTISSKEEDIVKKQIQFYKKYRKIFIFGHFFRLQSPFESHVTAWMIKENPNLDKSEMSQVRKPLKIIVGYYEILRSSNRGFSKLRLTNLEKESLYHVIEGGNYIQGLEFTGAELMNAGIYWRSQNVTSPEEISKAGGYFRSLVIIFEEVVKM